MTLAIYLKTPDSFSQEKKNQSKPIKEGERCHFSASEENAVLWELL